MYRRIVASFLVALVLSSMVGVGVAGTPPAADMFFDFLQGKRASDDDQNQLRAIEDQLIALGEDTGLMNFVYRNMDDFDITVVAVNITKKGDVLKTFYVIRGMGILDEKPDGYGYVNVTFCPTIKQAQKALAIISSGEITVDKIIALVKLYVMVEKENAPSLSEILERSHWLRDFLPWWAERILHRFERM
jgi:hypothetical protein